MARYERILNFIKKKCPGIFDKYIEEISQEKLDDLYYKIGKTELENGALRETNYELRNDLKILGATLSRVNAENTLLKTEKQEFLNQYTLEMIKKDIDKIKNEQNADQN